MAAINEAHRLLDTVADRRRDVLSEHASDAHHQERARASAPLGALATTPLQAAGRPIPKRSAADQIDRECMRHLNSRR